MALASKSPNIGRPLSPHLSIWRWGPGMAVSIFHRMTGQGMAFIGLPILLWWLGAMASGAGSYAVFQEHMGAWYGIVVLIGLTWAFFQHMSSGIRHWVLDSGAGYELRTNRTWSVMVFVIGAALTAVFWSIILLR